jgi:RNA polymerase sigma-70 factor (ECF subfamily)
MSEEERLIAAASRGDAAAFEKLVRSRQEKVFWTAYQVVGHIEDARDVAQHVFLRLWQVLPRYRPAGPFSAWLHRITINLAIDACRRRQARPELPASDRLEPLAAPASATPGAELRRREIQQIFRTLARRLSPQQRAVFVLKEMNDLDTAEIAEIMELSPSTVRNHLHQARKQLRRGLAAEFPEYLPGGSGRSDGR